MRYFGRRNRLQLKGFGVCIVGASGKIRKESGVRSISHQRSLPGHIGVRLIVILSPMYHHLMNLLRLMATDAPLH